MANTEVRNLLQLVREAEDAVDTALARTALTPSQRDVLDETSDRLRELDNQLVLEDLRDSLANLKKTSTALASLNKKVQKEIAKLKGVATKVGKVADGVGALIKAFEILARAGIA